uniref:Uncharacterized protein n=1 Tax=Zea mays TaxID=4577 RepID=C4IYY1_MAIZE|nr:unknown [Zea mays]
MGARASPDEGASARRRCSWSTEFTATASPCETCSIQGRTSSRRLAATPRKEKWTRTERARSARRTPTSRRSSRPGGDGGPMPVRRSDGGPPGRSARAWISAGHWRPCMMLKSMMCTCLQPWTASRMAWLAVKCANLR